jgi:hypothetical protein
MLQYRVYAVCCCCCLLVVYCRFSELLVSCWDEDWKVRPSFTDICSKLQEMIQEAAAHHTPKVYSTYTYKKYVLISVHV